MRQRFSALRGLIGGLAAIVSLAAVAPMAAAQDRWGYCNNSDGRHAPKFVVEGCSAILLHGGHSKAELATILVLRGRAYSAQTDFARAIADFDSAIKNDPKFTAAYLYRGFAHESLGEYDRSMADFSAAIEVDPKSALAYNMRGRGYQRKGEFARAIAEYDAALAIDPKYTSSYSNRSRVYSFLKDYARSIADADQAALLSPTVAGYQSDRCWVRAIANQDLDTAREACEAAFKLWKQEPRRFITFESRGMISLRQERWQDAWKDYDAAVQIDSKEARPRYGRGIAALRLGRTAEGQADLAAAAELDPTIAATYSGYGITP